MSKIITVNQDVNAIEAHRQNYPNSKTLLWAAIECQQHHIPAGIRNKKVSEPYSQKNTLPILYKGGNNK